MRLAVVGAGSWGSAVAWLLGNNGHQVCIWARDAELVSVLNREGKNPRYLSEVQMPPSVKGNAELAQALDGAEAVVLATPSVAARQTGVALAAFIGKDSARPALPLLLLSKGIEHESGKLLLDVLAEELGAPERLAVLSGPNHAEEVARGLLSATVVAARSPEVAALFQTALSNANFRVYTAADTTGVQLCGAAKNVIAIAAGVAAGLGLGDNSAAMLMTRGLAEISRLAVALGGEQQTCMGLAGMGDLIVTCTSHFSRNRSFGEELARGGTLEAYMQRTHMVVEGAVACRSLPLLAQGAGIEMPISEHVRAVVWEGREVQAMLASLLERPAKPEFY